MQAHDEVEYYPNLCAMLEKKNAELEEEIKHKDRKIEHLTKELERFKGENNELRKEIASLKVTVSAVVARSIGAKTASKKKHYRKAGRRKGHKGKSRRKPAHIDSRVELDQTLCPECDNELSEPTDSYKRVIEDIVPARIVVIEYKIVRRYCRNCRKQVSPRIPNV